MLTKELLEANEMTDDLIAFLPNLIEALETSAVLLYERRTDELWELFGQVVTALNDVYKTLNALYHIYDANEYLLKESIQQFRIKLETHFALLNQYIDNEQYIEAADIIQYEYIVLFQSFSLILGETDKQKQDRFNKNMTYFQREYPSIHDVLKNLSLDLSNYQMFYSADGSANLRFKNEDGQETNFYSKYNPLAEAAYWTKSIAEKASESRHALIFGLGFGYHVYAFAKEYPKARIYIVEPDPQVLLASMYVVNWDELLEELPIADVAVGGGMDDLQQLLDTFCSNTGDKLYIQDTPIYESYYKVEKLAFMKQVKLFAGNYRMNLNTIRLRFMQHTKNILFNVAANISTPSLANYKNAFEGISAVVVGAGPSLALDIDKLKQLKDHSLIIAAGSSIQSLQHFGIEPHLVVSMDGADINYTAFESINRENIPLVYIPQVEYRIVDAHYENSIHAYFSNDEISKYIMGCTSADPIFESNNSVSGTAIQIAIYLGAKEVIFTGQDLSFPTDDMYAPGARHIEETGRKSFVASAEQWVENNNGTMNRTASNYFMVLKDIEQLLAKYPEIVFTNTSGIGAKIKNTKFEPMQNVLQRLKLAESKLSLNIENHLKDHARLYDAKRLRETEKRLFELPRQMQELERTLIRMKSNLYDLADLCNKNPQQCLKKMNLIQKDWAQIIESKLFKSIYKYALLKEIKDFSRYAPRLSEEKNISQKAILYENVLGKLVDVMHKQTPELKGYVDEAIRRVQSLSAKDNS